MVLSVKQPWTHTRPPKQLESSSKYAALTYCWTYQVIRLAAVSPGSRSLTCASYVLHQVSYVELVASTSQPPKWFVSHWWGEPVFDFISCLERHSQDHADNAGALTYWVCAYANNQWKLDEELEADLTQTSFRQALDLADGTVTILDALSKTFTRVWCCYEIFVSLTASERQLKYEVYTAHKHNTESGRHLAVGLTDGLAAVDRSVRDKVEREKPFPEELLVHALRVQLQTAEASIETDRNRILNTIAGKNPDPNSTPPTSDPAYEALNNVLAGRFAEVAIGRIGRGQETEDRLLVLRALSRSGKATLTLNMSITTYAQFDENMADDLFRHLPKGLRALHMPNSGLCGQENVHASLRHVRPLCEALKRLDSLTVADFRYNPLGNDAATKIANIGNEKSISLCGILPDQTEADFTPSQNNMLFMRSCDIILLAASLPVASSLTSCDVRQNEMSADSASLLSAAILNSTSIEKYNTIPVKELRADSLTRLDLRRRWICDDGAMVVASLLPAAASLTEVDLRSNKLGDAGWCAVFDALRDNPQNKISKWDLALQSISPVIATSLAAYMAAGASLTSCDVRDNQISGDGASQLSAAVLNNINIEQYSQIPIKEMRADSLTTLDLAGVDLAGKCMPIGIDGGMVVGGLLPVAASLTEINLHANRLKDEGAEVIMSALKESTTSKLQKLVISQNDISEKGATSVAAYLAVAASLTSCNVLNNQMDVAAATLLVEAVEGRDVSLCGVTPNQTFATFRNTNLQPPDAVLLASDLSKAGVCASLTEVLVSPPAHL